LAITVQLFGTMCNIAPIPKGMFGYSCLFVMMRADLLMPAEEYKTNITYYAAKVRKTRPVEGGPPVRVPYARSIAERRQKIKADEVDIFDTVHENFLEIAQSNSRRP
jgi:delta1-piperideine-2-carboxylate reductase